MEDLVALLNKLMMEGELVQATLSNPRVKGEGVPTKVKARPVRVQGERKVQLEKTVGTKALHENVTEEEAAGRLGGLLATTFKQGLLQAKEADYHVLINKKGHAAILRKPPTATAKAQAAAAAPVHNRKKQYQLPEGEPVPFLVELGVMNAQGKVLAGKYDKFRQINRFLEIVADLVPALSRDRTLTIVDFGCGKSYLTFALYHYLEKTLGLDIRITGLDLKADVIAHCSGLAERLGYERLQFAVGDIGQYAGESKVDLVVTLHACDTATDAALDKAVRWGADAILSVPCCQHELNPQLTAATLAPMLDHGIIRERFAALATDSVRAQLLELVGYKAQILEFIDMEHTPKNLLIRAVRQKHPAAYVQRQAEAYRAFRDFLGIDPYLERALRDRLVPVLER